MGRAGKKPEEEMQVSQRPVMGHWELVVESVMQYNQDCPSLGHSSWEDSKLGRTLDTEKDFRKDIDPTLTVSRQKKKYGDRVPPRPGQELPSAAQDARLKGSNVASRIPEPGPQLKILPGGSHSQIKKTQEIERCHL